MYKLLSTINELKENQLIKENENYKEELISIQKRLEDKSFKLAVVGEFSSGKSTFINALIGKDLLKHATLETTATVTYIHNIDSKDKTKIKVNYNNGEIKEYLDYKYIKDTTTTASQEDVAMNIDFVDIYIPFVNIKSDLTIVDTPGLNGTADNHREKTIEEIKKSHACIYLLQKNGITDSDREFIRFLFNYQNNFIFVQNFIDELKESEGEYLSKKLDFLKRDIEKIIEKENVNIDYNITGVSALKGLVGKDKSIRNLYENDIFDLTDERREIYLQESNILKIEDIIKDLYKKKNNIKSRIKLTTYSLLVYLEEVIDKENSIIALNNSLIKEDISFKDKELVDKRILELKENKNVIIQKLKNLVNSEFMKYKKLLNKDIEERLEEIHIEISQIISKESDYEIFDKKFKNQYFVNELQKRIDCYKDKIEEYEYYIIQDIYKSMLTRLNKYSQYSSKRIDNLDNIHLVETKKVDLNFNEKREEIERLKNELYKNKSTKESLEDNIFIIQDIITNINSKYNINQRKKEQLNKNKINDERKLGVRPKKYIEGYDYIEVEVERSGFIGGIMNFLCGPKTETESIPRYNDKKGIEWDRKKRDLNMKYQRELESINKELNYLRNQQNELNSKLEKDKMNFEKSNRMIKYLDTQIQVRKEELKQYETNAKKEYLATRKKEMINGINNYLYNTNEDNKSVKEIFIEKINFDFRENKKIIEKEILKECTRYIKNEIERLEAIKNDSIDKLNEKYNKNSKYLEQIKEIYNKVEIYKDESTQTRI